MTPKVQIQHFNLGNSDWYDSLVDLVNAHFEPQIGDRCHDRFSDLRHAHDNDMAFHLIEVVSALIRDEDPKKPLHIPYSLLP